MDTTFNTTGIVTEQLQYDDKAYSVELQNDEKNLVGGFSDEGFALARYTT